MMNCPGKTGILSLNTANRNALVKQSRDQQ